MTSNDKSINTMSPEDREAFCQDFVKKVTDQSYCLNNTLWNSKLKKLLEGQKLIKKTNETLTAMASRSQSVCKSGCAYCCCQIFKVTALELEVITFYLIKNPVVLQAFVRNYLLRLEKMEQYVLQQMYEKYTYGSAAEQQEISIKYFQLSNPCAFLNQQGACLIYQFRPLVCAAFISYDVSECIKAPSGSSPLEMKQLFTSTLHKVRIASKKPDFEADLSTMVFRHLEDVVERGGQAVRL
jgi:Fe-S-cluster containining protein